MTPNTEPSRPVEDKRAVSSRLIETRRPGIGRCSIREVLMGAFAPDRESQAEE